MRKILIGIASAAAAMVAGGPGNAQIGLGITPRENGAVRIPSFRDSDAILAKRGHWL
jgi:hypothetical protein